MDPSELNGKLQTRDNSSLSYYSHNIRSLPGHWNDHKELLSTLYEETSFKFTCIALQEIWNIPSGVSYDLPGYHKLVYKIRDESGMNGNAGGGIGIWVDSKYEFEVLDNISLFESRVYESIFIKIKVDKKDVIVGNCYRPNSAPFANLDKALEMHSSILSKIKLEYKNCPVVLLGDLNIDLLQFSTHNSTNQYLECLLSNGFLPIVTFPTRVHKRSATLIDHVFSNTKSNVIEAGIITTPLSDHFPVFYIEKCKVKSQGPTVFKPVNSMMKQYSPIAIF